MQVIYNDWSKVHANLENVGLGETHDELDLTVFVRSPPFEGEVPGEPESDYMSYVTDASVVIDDVKAMEMWQEAPNSGTSTVTLGATTTTSPTKNIVYSGNDWTYEGDPIFASAFAVSTTSGNILFFFRPDTPVLLWGDGEDDITSSVGILPGGGTILSYLETAVLGAASPQIGEVSVAVPTASWEAARAAHVWMDPQRVNTIVNSSFEVDDFGWRSNDTMSFISGGIGRGGRAQCLEVSGTESTKIVESLPFPTTMGNRYWSVEAYVAGQGEVRLGLLFWDQSGDPSYLHLRRSAAFPVTAGDPTGSVSRDDFRQISVLIPNQAEVTMEAQLRIEFEGDSANNKLWVDDCIVEPNEARLGYFDGEWDVGQRGDYSWYGKPADQTTLAHKSFSVFYNNRVNLNRQLFGYYEDDGTYHKGTADDFAPEGVAVIPHWDDIYSIKKQSWMEDIYVPVQDHTDDSVVATPATTEDPT